MLSDERAGFVFDLPDCRNCISNVTVDAVGFVTQIEVVNTDPSAPCTWPAAGTMRSVPVKPSACVRCCAVRGNAREATTSSNNAPTRERNIGLPPVDRLAGG